jgi:hypothetical protein
MKELMMAIKRSTLSFQIRLLTPVCSSLTLSHSLLLDANLELGLIPSVANDQESSWGADQSANDEEPDDVPHPQPIDGKNWHATSFCPNP